MLPLIMVAVTSCRLAGKFLCGWRSFCEDIPYSPPPFFSRFAAKEAWKDVREMFEGKEDFEAITSEEDRERLFNDFVKSDPWSSKVGVVEAAGS